MNALETMCVSRQVKVTTFKNDVCDAAAQEEVATLTKSAVSTKEGIHTVFLVVQRDASTLAIPQEGKSALPIQAKSGTAVTTQVRERPTRATPTEKKTPFTIIRSNTLLMPKLALG